MVVDEVAEQDIPDMIGEVTELSTWINSQVTKIIIPNLALVYNINLMIFVLFSMVVLLMLLCKGYKTHVFLGWLAMLLSYGLCVYIAVLGLSIADGCEVINNLRDVNVDWTVNNVSNGE